MLRIHHWQAVALIIPVIAVGCSKEDLTGALDKAKNAVAEGTEKGKQLINESVEKTQEEGKKMLNLAGSMDLNAGEPVKTNACYVSWLPQGSGRPTVLQLQSYRDMERDSPPFVFLQAQVQANSLAELVGEPLSARLFVQRAADGPVLFSDVSAPIEFKLASIEEKQASFELSNAALRDSSTGAEIPVTGTMVGSLE